MGRQRPAAERLPSQRAPLSEIVEQQVAESAEMIELRRQLALAESQRGTQRRRADTAEAENTKLREQLAARAEPRGKLGKSAQYEHATRFANEFDAYDTSDLLPIWVGVLRILCKRRAPVDLRAQLVRSKFFKPVVTQIEVVRDTKIATYLKENVFPAAAFALSRLLINISKRECQLLNQIFKHQRRADGSKSRWRLCDGSAQFAPELFSLIGINEVEQNTLDASGVTFEQSEDRWGATVGGAPYSVDVAIMNNLDQAQVSRVGGMATKGTIENPHLLNMTGDGAGLSNAFTGVRGGISPGSSEYLAQSSARHHAALHVQGELARRGVGDAQGALGADQEAAGAHLPRQGAQAAWQAVGGLRRAGSHGGQAIRSPRQWAAHAQPQSLWCTVLWLQGGAALRLFQVQAQPLRADHIRDALPPCARASA